LFAVTGFKQGTVLVPTVDSHIPWKITSASSGYKETASRAVFASSPTTLSR
jgi:hypothetical protein